MKRASDLPVFLALRAVLGAVNIAPRSLALAAGAAAGRAARGMGMRRDVVDDNLRRAFPEKTDAERTAIAKETYAHFGRCTVDSMRMSMKGPAAVIPLVDGGDTLKLIEDRLARGGMILLTGHLGNWELAAAYLAARGYPVAAVVKAPSNPHIAEHAARTRALLGVETIMMHDAMRVVPEALKAGRLVGLVADQGAARSEVWPAFFGVPTQTPVGPGLFAARSGCPVIFGALLASQGGRYRLVGEVLEDHPTSDAEAMVTKVAETYRRRLEALVRLVPGQYLWTHRLWKRTPPRVDAPAAP